jgi:hypothetical protein
MTMYLPNPDLHATGYEPGEFIEAHHTDEPGDRPVAEPGARTEQRDVPTAHLDTQTRIDITRWAEEYISGLVENHHGDREDVRAVIHDLHYQTNLINANREASP